MPQTPRADHSVHRITLLHLSLFATILPCSLFLFLLIKFFNAHAVKNSNHNLNLPPGPKKLPLIGNLHQLVGAELPHNRLNNLAKVYGPIYHLKVGELTIIVLSSHEAAQEVLKAQEINFAQRPLFQTVEMMMVDVNSSLIFAPHGEYWRQIQRICVSELLSTKRVRPFRSIREDEMRNLIDFVHSLRGRPFNLSSKNSSCLMAIVLKATFGESCKQKDELLSALKEGEKQSGGFSVADIFPSCRILRYVNGTKRRLDGIRQKYNETMDCIVNDHKKQRETMSSTQEESSVKEDSPSISSCGRKSPTKPDFILLRTTPKVSSWYVT